MNRWVFVYNADSGWASAALDWAHKLVSPQTYACDLCRLTYGPWGRRRDWVEALARLPDPQEFCHRDEFVARYPGRPGGAPAVWRVEGEVWTVVVGPEDWAGVADLTALVERLEGWGSPRQLDQLSRI